MAGIRGRAVLLRRGGVNLAGVRTKSISINASSIDVTNDDDDAIRKLLEQPGQVDVAISVSGIMLSETLRSVALSTSDRVAATDLVYQGPDASPADSHGWSGDFFFASYKETGEYQGAVTFEAELQSAGAVTYTAP